MKQEQLHFKKRIFSRPKAGFWLSILTKHIIIFNSVAHYRF